MTTRSAISRCPTILAAPPIMQCLPMRVLPAMPVQPAIAVCAPMRTLCPTWIRLSSLTPSSTTVSSSAPRSMQVLAPISTSSPITTAAGLRNLSPDALLQDNAEAIGADHRAGMHQRALAQATTRVNGDARMQAAGGADLDRIAEVATGADHYSPAQLHAAAHIRSGADAGAGRDPRPAFDDCGPVHAGFGHSGGLNRARLWRNTGRDRRRRCAATA